MGIVYFDSYNTDDRLFCKWVMDDDAARGLIISVAYDDIFLDTHRMFLLPTSASTCTLSVGPGAWYVRIGCFLGNANEGIIEWSGIKGPIELTPSTTVIPLPPAPYDVLHHRAHDSGYRVVLRDAPSELYYIMRRTLGLARSWHYKYTPLHKFVDMPAPVQHVKYTFQLWTFPAFPTASIESIPDGYVFTDVQAEPPVVLKDSQDRVTHNVHRVILAEAIAKPVKFASHADYLRYQTALARTSRR